MCVWGVGVGEGGGQLLCGSRGCVCAQPSSSGSAVHHLNLPIFCQPQTPTPAHVPLVEVVFLTSDLHTRRLVAVLDGWAHVHALQTLAQLRILETPSNPRGLAALTPCSEPCFLALPASSSSGVLRVYDLLVDGGHVVCEVLGGYHPPPLATQHPPSTRTHYQKAVQCACLPACLLAVALGALGVSGVPQVYDLLGQGSCEGSCGVQGSRYVCFAQSFFKPQQLAHAPFSRPAAALGWFWTLTAVVTGHSGLMLQRQPMYTSVSPKPMYTSVSPKPMYTTVSPKPMYTNVSPKPMYTSVSRTADTAIVAPLPFSCPSFAAHKSPLAAMAWNHNGTYLATASSTGTVIR